MVDPNSKFEKQLESAIEQELRELPVLKASTNLTQRVMAEIARRAALPWYRQSWSHWPWPAQLAALVGSLALVGGLCYGTWYLPQTAVFAAVSQRVGGVTMQFGVLWNFVNVLFSAAVAVVKHLGLGFIIAAAVVAAVGYAVCVGVGTLYVRLAFARRPGI